MSLSLRATLAFFLLSLTGSASCQSPSSPQGAAEPVAALHATEQLLPLTGTFFCDAFEVHLDDSAGTGIFTQVTSGMPQAGDVFLTVHHRTAASSWQGTVFDSSLRSRQAGNFSIRGNFLRITIPRQGTYHLRRRQEPVFSQDTRASVYVRAAPRSKKGSPCDAVRCQGITQVGSRCRRTTRNCDGFCWQH